MMIKKKHIVSPMPTGSGAYVVHSLLEKHIPEYRLIGYNPYWSLFPFSLPLTVPAKGADLIHTAPDYAWYFYRKSIPLVITFHNYVLDRWMKPYCSLIKKIHYATDLRLFIRLALQKAHIITAVSHFTASLVKKDLNISQPVKVIYNGVDINQFTPGSASRSFSKDFRVFFSGNLTMRKGAHWLPSIVKHLKKNTRIYYTQGFRSQINLPAAARLQPIGSVPFKDMANRYRQMDLLVMPSVREGFGLAVAEAMACGLPVVATNCSAIPELIDEGKGGFLCPVGNIEAFSERINLLADSPTLRREMGEYNRAKVEKMFTLDRMIKEYKGLFQEVLG
jgi:glycosyltransferase involved in cell wall biosynthesis